jgi:two-component system sensor histidine kinase HydH
VTRWALVAAVVAMGAALLVTVLITYSTVSRASATVVRGQVDALEQAVRAGVAEVEAAPEDADLAALIEEERGAGLRFVAVYDPLGMKIASAGTPVAALPPFERGRRFETERIGERVRAVFRAGRRPRLGEGRPFAPEGPRRGGRGYFVIMEIEPIEANALREAALTTLGIGGLSATMLLAAALWLGRSVLRREALARKAERDKRLASLGEMSAVLAHEIRNPLASLKGNAQLLAALLPAGDKARQKADRVVDEAVRLETLSNDLLEFVRTGSLKVADADPAEILRAAAASVDPDIVVDVTGAPPRWSFDAERVREVLINLLENAVQAGAPVHARVALDDGQLLFEVRDAGAGIAPEDLDHIFEPFFTRRTRGTGLGLAVARRVVELHGGGIEAGNSEPGGAVFRITLPPR